MKYYAPDYYEKFKCIAGKCRHSCCIGWEIDIDDDTLALYDTVGGDMGDRLKKHIDRESECAHFILGENERCPFLNEKNLCDLIIELGDGSLCDICADHPRFRNFYADRTEEGLGLSCEEAAGLILTNTEKVHLILTGDDGEEDEADDSDTWFLNLRDKVTEMLQRRDVPVDMRLMGVVAALDVKLPRTDWESLKQVYLSLERLEDDWTDYLERLTDTTVESRINLDTAYEQLLVYLVFRNFKADDIRGSMKFCAVSYLVIRHICEAMGGTMDVLLEVCRRYSSEIEYSDENIGRIIEEL